MDRNRLLLRAPLVLSVCGSLLVASLGWAEEDEVDGDFGRRGWYVAASAIGALSNYRDTPGDVGDSVGLDAHVGYRLNPRAAMELEFEWVDPFLERAGNASVLAEHRSYAIGLNGKLFLSDAAVQPYAIIGANVLIVSESEGGMKKRESDWGFRGGGGVDFHVSRRVALNLEVSYLWGVGDVWQRDYTSVGAGLMYRF